MLTTPSSCKVARTSSAKSASAYTEDSSFSEHEQEHSEQSWSSSSAVRLSFSPSTKGAVPTTSGDRDPPGANVPARGVILPGVVEVVSGDADDAVCGIYGEGVLVEDPLWCRICCCWLVDRWPLELSRTPTVDEDMSPDLRSCVCFSLSAARVSPLLLEVSVLLESPSASSAEINNKLNKFAVLYKTKKNQLQLFWIMRWRLSHNAFNNTEVTKIIH